MTGPTPPLTAEEQQDRTPAENLPAPLGRITLPGIDLDVEAMRVAAPQVRDRLTAELRHGAALIREARGTVVVPEDTYDLVRRLTEAQEVMTQWAQAFSAAAKECTALLEEEALTAVGSYPGIEEAPSGSLFVPDGQRSRIAVRPEWKTGDSTWDVPTLTAWVAEQVVSAEGVGLDGEDAVFTPQEALSICRDTVDKLLSLGKFTPGAAKIEAERKRLAGLQRDTDAAVLRQVRTAGLRQYQGVKVTREDVKP